MENIEIELKPEVNTNEIETEISAGKKIEEKEVEKSLNYNALTKEEQEAIDSFNSKIDVTDTTQVLQYS